MQKEFAEVTEKDIDHFMASFCPFGYRDIETAIENYRDAGKDDDELTEAIQNFVDDVDVKLSDVDPVYVAFDTLQQEARTEIENATGKDISNDDPFSSVCVYGNYMCTEFDGTDEAREATRALIDTMEEKSDVVMWYYSKM